MSAALPIAPFICEHFLSVINKKKNIVSELCFIKII